jgi:hypothetical protein
MNNVPSQNFVAEFKFNYYGYKIYNRSNVWYILDNQNKLIKTVCGYSIINTLESISHEPIQNIRNLLGWESFA